MLDARQGKALADAISEKCGVHRFTATLPVNGWTLGNDGLYSNTVSVSGVLATDQAGNTGLVQSGNAATDALRRAAWNSVVRAVAGAGTIAFYALEAAEVELPFVTEVFR